MKFKTICFALLLSACSAPRVGTQELYLRSEEPTTCIVRDGVNNLTVTTPATVRVSISLYDRLVVICKVKNRWVGYYMRPELEGREADPAFGLISLTARE
jgi:hypothetical protein